MTWEEFETAYKEIDGTARARGLQANNAVREAVQAVYRSRKGDTLWSDEDRHRRCALWVRDHQPTVLRLANYIGRRWKLNGWQAFKEYSSALADKVLTGELTEADAEQQIKSWFAVEACYRGRSGNNSL
jgi:hypothetical protein